MAEKQIRLPKWNGEEYYPATTTDAVADKERRKALSEIISDIEQDIQIQSVALNNKQNQLKYYDEGESFARMYYVKKTVNNGNISIAHTLNDSHAGIYYAERDASGQVTHEDNIYLTETYGNDNGHIGISSVDNENGVTVRSSRITIKPTLITLQNNSGFLSLANDVLEMRSNKSNDGLDSAVRLTKEQAWLMHYLPDIVDYTDPSTGETEQRQSGIGIVVTDDHIAFYSEVGNYNAPLIIRKDGTIYMQGVSNDLANYLLNLGSGGSGGSSIIVVDNLTSTSATNALSANMGRMLAQEILKMAPKTYVDTAIASAITTTLNTEV
jgi:hypothetical protein